MGFFVSCLLSGLISGLPGSDLPPTKVPVDTPIPTPVPQKMDKITTAKDNSQLVRIDKEMEIIRQYMKKHPQRVDSKIRAKWKAIQNSRTKIYEKKDPALLSLSLNRLESDIKNLEAELQWPKNEGNF
jgi:hypothetical protein